MRATPASSTFHIERAAPEFHRPDKPPIVNSIQRAERDPTGAGKSWHAAVLGPEQQGPASGTLLVEDVDSLISLHHLCMYGHIICRARGYRPAFLCGGANKPARARDVSPYFPLFDLIEAPGLGLLAKVRHLAFAFFVWIRLLKTHKLLELSWEGMLIGDVVYDQYLAVRSRATLHYEDIRLAKLIFQIVCAVDRSTNLILTARPAALLLSHKVGYSAATLAIAAEKLGTPIYSIGGGRFGTLVRSVQRKDYEYNATPAELAPLLALSPVDFDSLFESVCAKVLKGNFNADATLAFRNRLYLDRGEFADSFSLNPSRKNVFVMLHAFNDYPHSHFKGMLFDDFFDWFMKTLEFACRDTTVNWIVKEHPASHYYPVTDVDWGDIKRRFSAPHVVFMGPDANFNSMSIGHVGDAVVTCLGSAGFEFSALGGVPSITASDNPYATAGFAICPRTRAEYFDVLAGLSRVEKLSPEKQRRAKAAFMFIHQLSRVEMSSIPDLSHAEQRELQFDSGYFARVEAQVSANRELVERQLGRYIEVVGDPDFRSLRTMPQDLLANACKSSAFE